MFKYNLWNFGILSYGTTKLAGSSKWNMESQASSNQARVLRCQGGVKHGVSNHSSSWIYTDAAAVRRITGRLQRTISGWLRCNPVIAMISIPTPKSGGLLVKRGAHTVFWNIGELDAFVFKAILLGWSRSSRLRIPCILLSTGTSWALIGRFMVKVSSCTHFCEFCEYKQVRSSLLLWYKVSDMAFIFFVWQTSSTIHPVYAISLTCSKR